MGVEFSISPFSFFIVLSAGLIFLSAGLICLIGSNLVVGLHELVL